MTLSIAWLRAVGDSQELIMASDSRLRFGCAWDCCPKIMQLTRGDSVMCFAGDTQHAYPLMLQLSTAVDQHFASKTREKDLLDLRHVMLQIMNGMRDHIHDLPVGQTQPDIPEAVLLLGGYSWRTQEFGIWLLHFDSHIGRFTFRPASAWRGQADARMIAFAGDSTDEARSRLIEMLRQRGKLDTGGFDMEPFEVLRDMIRQNVDPAIGGPPQLVKVYRHLNTTPIAVRWPDGNGALTLLGRPFLDYERTQRPVLDPDTLAIATAWDFV